MSMTPRTISIVASRLVALLLIPKLSILFSMLLSESMRQAGVSILGMTILIFIFTLLVGPLLAFGLPDEPLEVNISLHQTVRLIVIAIGILMTCEALPLFIYGFGPNNSEYFLQIMIQAGIGIIFVAAASKMSNLITPPENATQ